MREQLSLSDIQYGPFLPFLRKKDVTDIDLMAENCGSGISTTSGTK